MRRSKGVRNGFDLAEYQRHSASPRTRKQIVERKGIDDRFMYACNSGSCRARAVLFQNEKPPVTSSPSASWPPTVHMKVAARKTSCSTIATHTIAPATVGGVCAVIFSWSVAERTLPDENLSIMREGVGLKVFLRSAVGSSGSFDEACRGFEIEKSEFFRCPWMDSIEMVGDVRDLILDVG